MVILLVVIYFFRSKRIDIYTKRSALELEVVRSSSMAWDGPFFWL